MKIKFESEAVSSKSEQGVEWGQTEMAALRDQGVVTRVRPGAHGGAGRGAQISPGGVGRGAQVCALVRPANPGFTWVDELLPVCRTGSD